LHVRISDIANGAITAYLNYNNLAGACPCYTSDLSCTGDDQDNSCDLDIDYCDFQAGSWYVGVTASHPVDPTSPIGFTITGWILPPPVEATVSVNSTTNGVVNTNESIYYVFNLASATPTTELVATLIVVHSDGDSPQLTLLINYNNLADEDCNMVTCVAEENEVGNAYCTIVIDPCQLSNGVWSMTVVGDIEPNTQTHYTLVLATRGTITTLIVF
jgi:hypothetical protein